MSMGFPALWDISQEVHSVSPQILRGLAQLSPMGLPGGKGHTARGAQFSIASVGPADQLTSPRKPPWTLKDNSRMGRPVGAHTTQLLFTWPHVPTDSNQISTVGVALSSPDSSIFLIGRRCLPSDTENHPRENGKLSVSSLALKDGDQAYCHRSPPKTEQEEQSRCIQWGGLRSSLKPWPVRKDSSARPGSTQRQKDIWYHQAPVLTLKNGNYTLPYKELEFFQRSSVSCKRTRIIKQSQESNAQRKWEGSQLTKETQPKTLELENITPELKIWESLNSRPDQTENLWTLRQIICNDPYRGMQEKEWRKPTDLWFIM
jgi:hypothetical protein